MSLGPPMSQTATVWSWVCTIMLYWKTCTMCVCVCVYLLTDLRSSFYNNKAADTCEPVTMVLSLNFRLETVWLWYSSMFNISPLSKFHTLQHIPSHHHSMHSHHHHNTHDHTHHHTLTWWLSQWTQWLKCYHHTADKQLALCDLVALVYTGVCADHKPKQHNTIVSSAAVQCV